MVNVNRSICNALLSGAHFKLIIVLRRCFGLIFNLCTIDALLLLQGQLVKRINTYVISQNVEGQVLFIAQ